MLENATLYPCFEVEVGFAGASDLSTPPFAFLYLLGSTPRRPKLVPTTFSRLAEGALSRNKGVPQEVRPLLGPDRSGAWGPETEAGRPTSRLDAQAPIRSRGPLETLPAAIRL